MPLAATLSQGYNSPVPTVSPTIRVKVLFFGRLKEIVGRAEDFFDIEEGASIALLFHRYKASHPELGRYPGPLATSRNQEFVRWDTTLVPGDEVGFLPPVSGG
jgi:molybdopterin synthase sulfur carrier subunit